MAGICAAISAARHGAKTALVHDRPVLGGNASSEIRMWICGAAGKNNRETGIIDELMMKNQRFNPYKNYYIWDSVMYDTVLAEPNLELFLNTSCMDGVCESDEIKEITAWQLTSQTFHKFSAKIFIDCSGDSALAPIANAEFRIGRESKAETNEGLAQDNADSRTMGNSCIIQAREYPSERRFEPLPFAREISSKELLGRKPQMSSPYENFWQLELGGMEDTIHDAEGIARRLHSLAYGMWDYVKNRADNAEDNKNFDIDFIGALPGKRESRRYVGDYVLTQNDVYNEGRFDDVIAYSGWGIDDHDPGGFDNSDKKPNYAAPSPSPSGIPYRCIYSKNIKNLMFAGRNISATHIAMSATRVMATCATLGQAAGTAAAMAAHRDETPRDILKIIDVLRQKLMDDDCYIPFTQRRVYANELGARLSSDMEDSANLLSGFDRPISTIDNGAYGKPGCFAELKFDEAKYISVIRIILDNDLNFETGNTVEKTVKHNMLANYPLDQEESRVAATLVSDLEITLNYADGSSETKVITDNYYRHLEIGVNAEIISANIKFCKTRGAEMVHVFSLDVIE